MPVAPTILTRVAGDYWWPRWSPDGTRLLAGNTSVHVWDGTQWTERPPVSPDTPQWRMARWWHAGQILAIAATATGDPGNVFILPATPGGEPHVLPMADSGALWVNWAEVVADARDRPCWVGVRASDGVLFCQGVRQDLPDRHHGLVVGYPYTLLTTTESEWLFYRVTVTGLVYPTSRYRRPPGSNEYATDGSTIVFGNLDRVWRDTFDRVLDVTVTPWGRERLPLLRWDLSLPWVWTVSDRPDGTPLILGREPGDRRAIVIEGIAAKTFDVAFDEDAQIWRIAAYSDHEGHGRPGLVVCSVPVDAPRETLVAPPAPPPPVEQWELMSEPVSLWPLFVGAGPNQYPRRNPDDAGVYWDVHLAKLGDGVEHAWFVKTLDGRVYEWRAALPDETGRLWLCLIEDHDEHGRTYQFEDPRLCPIVVRAGEVYNRVTRLREWDRAREAWGPWTGPGADGRFRFRVHVVSVERSNYGRRRAVLEVDTYQDLEVFELVSNKGWSAWEEWRASAATTSSRTRTLVDGRRVGFVKRVEWPERFEGPRVWPVRPFGEWPRQTGTPSPSPTAFVTIVEPATWPVESTAPATLRCVARLTGEAGTITWTRRDATGAVVERVTNPAWDLDHTFRAASPGVWSIRASIERAGVVVDETARERKWIVHPAAPVEPPPGPPPEPERYAIYGNFLANAIEPWGFMALSWWVHDRPRFDRFCRAYVAAGYRHLPVALWGAYADNLLYDLRGDVSLAAAAIMALVAAGVTPLLMVLTDELDGRRRDPARDRAWVKDEFARIWQALPRDARATIPLSCGWEINSIPGYHEGDNPRQGDDLIALATAIADVTGAAPWVHFTPNWWGPHYERGDEDRWWRDVGPSCVGLLGQIRPDAPITLKGDPSAPDGLYLMLRYPRRSDGAEGIAGRLRALGKRFVLFEHSRDLERWRRVEAIVRSDGRVDGIC